MEKFVPSTGVPRVRRQQIVLSTCLFFLVATGWFLFSASDPALRAHLGDHAHNLLSPFLHGHGNEAPSHSSLNLQEIFNPIPLTQYSYTADDGREYTIAQDEPLWQTPLREKVLIVDIDTRSLHGENQILHDGVVPFDQMDALSAGILQHYMYAQIHGYDYKLIRPALIHNRFASWVKPSVLRKELQTHPIVVFMDEDAVWNHPEIPLEWLLNHWNVTASTSLTVSLDPLRWPDSKRRQGANTGFVIAQQSVRTQEILNAWVDCPTGRQFPLCEWWANMPVYEQSAFNEYVRYYYNSTTDIHELSCDETDMFPNADNGAADMKCSGTFIRHFFADKSIIKDGVAASMTPELARALHGEFLARVGELVDEEEVDMEDFLHETRPGSEWVGERG